MSAVALLSALTLLPLCYYHHVLCLLRLHPLPCLGKAERKASDDFFPLHVRIDVVLECRCSGSTGLSNGGLFNFKITLKFQGFQVSS